MPNLLQIIVYLLNKIKWQDTLIQTLNEYIDWLEEDKGRPPKATDLTNLDYKKLTIDDPPKIKEWERLDFKQLLQEAEEQGKPIKPVQRRKNSTSVSSSIRCAKCNAPHNYLYKNNGDSGQYRCKVCSTLFHKRNRYTKDIIRLCPHCEVPLDKIKERKAFDIYKCRYDACPYYIQELEQLSDEEQARYHTAPYYFKLRYIYREFHFSLEEIQSYGLIHSPVDLARIHSSPRLLGEILTYHVNYGLPAPKVAALIYDLHAIKISGQTILNYASAAGAQLHSLTQHYPYEVSDQLCGDETYIRVNGKWNYICYFFDAKNKIILSQRISENRDVKLAIQAIHDVLAHFTTVEIPEKLNLIVDGNPIYKIAQHFLHQHNFHFDITQVIGLTNEDDVSKKYRPLKQIIERLNRTYKGHYRGKHGFKSQNGARAHVACFTACFNFLRPHQALNGNVPVVIPGLDDGDTPMPEKWIRLLHLGNQVLQSELTE